MKPFVKKRIFFRNYSGSYREYRNIDESVARRWYIHSSGYTRDGLLYYDVATREPSTTWGNWRPYAEKL